MPIPQVETFETDITEEIRQKQGSVTDVLAAHSSAPTKTPNQTIIRLITFLIIFLLALLAVGIWYYLSIGKQNALDRQAAQTPVITSKPPISIKKILPSMGPNLERFVVHTSKESAGYVITINDYTAVYGSILANEKTFGNELIRLFNIDTVSEPIFKDVTANNQDMRVATLIVMGTSTEAQATTTEETQTKKLLVPPALSPATTTPNKIATSSKTSATSSKATSTATTTLLATSKSSATTTATTAPIAATVAEDTMSDSLSFDFISYGFIGTTTLLISTSQEKLLELRGGIIK